MTFDDGIWFGVWFSGFGIDDVSSEYGTVYFLHPFVEDLMTRFDVVVTKSLDIEFQIVCNFGSKVRLVGLHVVGIVACGLPLKYVAAVKIDEVVVIFAT